MEIIAVPKGVSESSGYVPSRSRSSISAAVRYAHIPSRRAQLGSQFARVRELPRSYGCVEPQCSWLSVNAVLGEAR